MLRSLSLVLVLALCCAAPPAVPPAAAGSGENDAGNTTVWDTNAATGVSTPLVSLYWHLGPGRVDSPAVSPAAIRPLVLAAISGSDAQLDAAGLALWPAWWQAQVVDRSVPPLPQGETISVREAMRRSLRKLALPVVAP